MYELVLYIEQLAQNRTTDLRDSLHALQIVRSSLQRRYDVALEEYY